jgi:antitoxin CptB
MIDSERLNRIRWRARRGLLENDIVLEKFFAQHAQSLDDELISGLDELLERSDNELMDLIMGRMELSTEHIAPQVLGNARQVLSLLRAV